MRADGATRLLCAVLALAVAAVVVASIGTRRSDRAAATGREFQRLVGGLGLGPALDLSRCAAAFDPRVGAVCPERVGPIPAGDAFSPDHAAALLPP